jgi:hypothetical protein
MEEKGEREGWKVIQTGDLEKLVFYKKSTTKMVFKKPLKKAITLRF